MSPPLIGPWVVPMSPTLQGASQVPFLGLWEPEPLGQGRLLGDIS